MTIYLSGFASRLSPGKQLCLNYFPLLISIRNETHYDVLKLPRSCTSKEVREAFITLSKENHPDKNQSDPSMHVRFVKINEAYRTLSKPSSRHAYDMSLSAKRILNPPYTTSSKTSGTYEEEFRKPPHDFNDPFMWHNVKNGEKSNNDSYYGIKGLKKVSNTVLLWFIFAFTVVGVLVQVIIIRSTASRRSDHILEQSRKNSILESMLREKAKLYGNEHQIQVLKNSLKATYNFDETDEETEDSNPIEN